MINVLHRIRTLVVSTAVIANMIGTCVLFVLVAIMNSDVVARGILHAPIRGVTEIVIFSLVLIVFLQLPEVVNSNKLTRSDGLLSVLRVKNPSIAGKLSRLIDTVAGIFMAMIAWTIWPEFVNSFETCQFFVSMEFGNSETNIDPARNIFDELSSALARCDYFGTPGIFTAPWWPAKLVMFFGVSLSSIVFIFKALPLGQEPE